MSGTGSPAETRSPGTVWNGQGTGLALAPVSLRSCRRRLGSAAETLGSGSAPGRMLRNKSAVEEETGSGRAVDEKGRPTRSGGASSSILDRESWTKET